MNQASLGLVGRRRAGDAPLDLVIEGGVLCNDRLKSLVQTIRARALAACALRDEEPQNSTTTKSARILDPTANRAKVDGDQQQNFEMDNDALMHRLYGASEYSISARR